MASKKYGSYEDELIARARELQRLATKRRKLKRQLKAVDQEIKHVRKLLNALRQASEKRRPDIAPSRLHGGVTGIAMMPRLADVDAGTYIIGDEVGEIRPPNKKDDRS